MRKTPTPPLRYPSGVIPQYLVDIREGPLTVVAGLAALLQLDTHVAFFGVLRSFFPMIALGLFVICALLDWPFALCVGTAIFFLTGNFACHQIFQQFLSSASGVVSSIGTLFLIGVAARINFRPRLIVLAGIAAGGEALLSPESHPLFLAGIGAGFGSLLLSRTRRRFDAMRAFTLLLVVCAAAVILGLPHLYQAIWRQTSALKGHPGDWIAQMAFFGEWLGISIVATDGVKPISTFTWVVQLLLLGTVVFGLICFFTARAAQGRNQLTDPMLSRIIGGALAVWICLFFIFLWMGRGYAMLKATDYFCFAPALCVGAAANNAFKSNSSPARRRISWLTLGGPILFASYAAVAYENKLNLLDRYKTNVEAGPPLSAYRLPSEGPAALVLPDFSGNAMGGSGPLDLFVYCNRWADIQIVFPPEDSVRYQPTANEFVPDHIFRLGTNPLLNEAFMDINRPPSQQMPALHELVENRGYLQLSTPALAPSEAWLGAEGNRKDGISRWLAGDVGRFRIYRSAGPSLPLHLNVRVRPGPDFRPDNRVRIIVDHQIIGEISPSDSNTSENHRFPLPNFASVFVEASLQIEGSRGGIRRIAVLSLFVD